MANKVIPTEYFESKYKRLSKKFLSPMFVVASASTFLILLAFANLQFSLRTNLYLKK